MKVGLIEKRLAKEIKKWASAEKLKVGDIEKKCSGEN